VGTLGTPLILADSTAPKALAGLPCSASALTAVEWEPRKDVAALPWRRLAFRRGIWMALLTARAGLPAGEETLRAVPLGSESDVSDVAVLLLPRSKEPPVAAYAVPESATTSETTEMPVAGDGRCTMGPFLQSVRNPTGSLGTDHGAGARRLDRTRFNYRRHRFARASCPTCSHFEYGIESSSSLPTGRLDAHAPHKQGDMM
jgi:hypothetical protein